MTWPALFETSDSADASHSSTLGFVVCAVQSVSGGFSVGRFVALTSFSDFDPLISPLQSSSYSK